MRKCMNNEWIPPWDARCMGGWMNGWWVIEQVEWYMVK